MSPLGPSVEPSRNHAHNQGAQRTTQMGERFHRTQGTVESTVHTAANRTEPSYRGGAIDMGIGTKVVLATVATAAALATVGVMPAGAGTPQLTGCPASGTPLTIEQSVALPR